MKNIMLALMLLAVAGCGPVHYHEYQTEVTRLNEQNEIIAVGTRLFICTDNRNWPCVRNVFAPEVLFDMTSLSGGQPGMKTPRQISDMWEQGLKDLKAIHHQAGNYQVIIKGDEADMFCYGIAYHYLPNPTDRNTRVFVGSYNFHPVKGAAGWKIDKFKFNLKFIDGNKDLEGSAKKPT